MSKLKVDAIEVNTGNALQLESNTTVVSGAGAPRSLTVSGATTLEGQVNVQAAASLQADVSTLNTPDIGTSSNPLGSVHATTLNATNANFDAINIQNQSVGLVLGSCRLRVTYSGFNSKVTATGVPTGVCVGMDSGFNGSFEEKTLTFSQAFASADEYRLILTPLIFITSLQNPYSDVIVQNASIARVGLKSSSATGLVVEVTTDANVNRDIGHLLVMKA
tara:strand:+ start:1830 stop:2489 length:660 start_codon:yes stop_codon:yes gene_type:complete